MLRSLPAVVVIVLASWALSGCQPPVCCSEDGDCGGALGCFEGRCSYPCASDDECAPAEVCVRPTGGRALGVCVAPGEDLGECRERSAPLLQDGGDETPRDAGAASDAGERPDAGGCVDDEHEPNDSRPNASPAFPTPATLTICRVDEDWFRVHVEEGQEVEVAIQFARNRGDLRLELYGPQPEGNLLVVAPLSADGRAARHVAVRNGVYAARVRAAEPEVSNAYTLRITVRAPGDAGVVEDAGFDAGPPDAGVVDDAGFDAGPPDAGVVEDAGFDAGPPDAGVVEDAGFDAGFDAGPMACVDDAFEDNDNRPSAALLPDDTTTVSAIACAGDPDLFRVRVSAGESLTVALVYEAPPGMRLTLSRPGEGVLGSSAVGNGLEQVTIEASSTGLVLVRVAAVSTGIARPYQLLFARSSANGCVDDGFEPNDSEQQATPLGLPALAEGQLCTPDPDFFVVNPGNRSELTVDLVDQPAGGLVLTVVRRADFDILAVSSGSSGPTDLDLGNQPGGGLLFIVAGVQDAAYTLTVQ